MPIAPRISIIQYLVQVSFNLVIGILPYQIGINQTFNRVFRLLVSIPMNQNMIYIKV